MNEVNRYNANLYKINLIRKKYKKNKLLLDMSFLNYEGFYLYLTVQYIKKLKTYKLYWFDLDDLDIKHIDKYKNELVFPYELAEAIQNNISGYDYKTSYQDEVKSIKNIVNIEINIPNKKSDKISITTTRFLPYELSSLVDIIDAIKEQMPYKTSLFFDTYTAKVLNTMDKYGVIDDLEFDMFKDNLEEIFGTVIYEKGLEYYKKNKVKFLEKIDNSYYACVNGLNKDKYAVVITPDSDNKTTRIWCSCPGDYLCEHAVATILAIRDKKFNKFAKVTYMDPTITSIERIENFSYFLCCGVSSTSITIINSECEIEETPLYDANNKCNWKVLSDTKDKMFKNLRKNK